MQLTRHMFSPSLTRTNLHDARGEYLWICHDRSGVPLVVYSSGDHLLPADYWNERHSWYSKRCMNEIANMPFVASGVYIGFGGTSTQGDDCYNFYLDFLIMCSRGFPVGFVGGAPHGHAYLELIPDAFCHVSSFAPSLSGMVGETVFNHSLLAIRGHIEHLVDKGENGQWQYVDFGTIKEHLTDKWNQFEDAAMSSLEYGLCDSVPVERDLESEFTAVPQDGINWVKNGLELG